MVPQGNRFTARGFQILKMVADGLTDKEIAVRLGIARRIVSNYVSVIVLKLGAARRTEAVSKALRQEI